MCVHTQSYFYKHVSEYVCFTCLNVCALTVVSVTGFAKTIEPHLQRRAPSLEMEHSLLAGMMIRNIFFSEGHMQEGCGFQPGQ